MFAINCTDAIQIVSYSSNSAAIHHHSSSDGTGICIGDRTSPVAMQTSNTISHTVDTPRVKLQAIVVISSQVARCTHNTTIYVVKCKTI